jgi:hypothetical protein
MNSTAPKCRMNKWFPNFVNSCVHWKGWYKEFCGACDFMQRSVQYASICGAWKTNYRTLTFNIFLLKFPAGHVVPFLTKTSAFKGTLHHGAANVFMAVAKRIFPWGRLTLYWAEIISLRNVVQASARQMETPTFLICAAHCQFTSHYNENKYNQ